MNEHQHFTKFRGLHRQGMALAQSETARFTSSNGSNAPKPLQQIVHLPDSLPWRQRLRLRIQKAVALVVRKTDDGTYQISKGVAGIFISAFLGVVVAGGLGLLTQRDEIVRLRTLQEIQDKTNTDMLSKIDQAGNKAMIADRNAARIEGKFDQFALTFSIKNADKAKLTLEQE
jgi:hypothetical protein